MSNFGHLSREKIKLQAGVDLDDVVEVGLYAVDDPTNGPAAGDWIVDIDIAVESGGTRHIVQTAKSVADGSMQVRVYNGTVWGAWAAVGGGGAVAAGDVTFTPAGSIAATDVQAAIEELDTTLSDHIADAADAHDASAISFDDGPGGIEADDVQAAIAELAVSTRRVEYTDDRILDLTDSGKIVEMNKATTVDVEVPPQVTIAWAADTRIDFTQIGAGQVTFTAGAGVTILSKDGNLALTGQYSGASLYRRAENTWVLIGDLSA